jgi:hypothetical protein
LNFKTQTWQALKGCFVSHASKCLNIFCVKAAKQFACQERLESPGFSRIGGGAY